MLTTIYVVQFNAGRGKVFNKIGITADFKRRLGALQTSSPFEIHIKHTINVPSNKARELEKELHTKLKKFRLKGEWFKEDKEYLAELKECIESILRMPSADIINLITPKKITYKEMIEIMSGKKPTKVKKIKTTQEWLPGEWDRAREVMRTMYDPTD